MLTKTDVETVSDLITAYKQGNLLVDRDAERIANAVAIVRSHENNPRLCSCVDCTHLEAGDAVSFLYCNPDCNEPWRFGVVDKFNAGCWTIFTFNIKKRRVKKKDGKEEIKPDLPGFRNYDLRKMERIRRVCRPAATEMVPAAAADFANLGQAVNDLVKKILGGGGQV